VDLVIIIALSLLLVPLVVLATGPLRIVLGLLFVLFFPGYTVVAALFPHKGNLSGIERLALSFGLSIAVVPLMGLVLNYTPWGIGLYPILISLLLFIAVMAAIAWYRRHRLSPEERFQPQLGIHLKLLSRSWACQGRWDRLLGLLVVMAIMGALGALTCVIASPKAEEKFTEFYILGLEGKAEGYPRKIILGEEGRVILGLVNREHETTIYKVEITIDGERAGEIGPITLDHGGKWEQEVSFAPTRAGPDREVEFLLFKGASPEPYQALRLQVDVLEGI